MSDGQRTNVPPDAVWESINVLLFGDGRKEARGGTRVLGLNMAALPDVRHYLDGTKVGNVITILPGFQNDFVAADVGRYYYWPTEDAYDLITEVLSTSSVRVDSTVARTRSATASWDPENEVWVYTGSGKVRGELNAATWDRVNKKHVILLGTKIYYADWDCTSWTEVPLIGSTAPADSKSILRQHGSDIYLWNSNGKYAIGMGLTTPVICRVNNSVTPITCALTGDAQDLIYCRRFIVTCAKMSGPSYFQNIREGNIVDFESAPAEINSSGKDYNEIFTTLPIGDGTYSRSLLTGGALALTLSEWEAISDGQFGCTFDGVTNNIVVNFTGIATWDDFTERIQTALQYFWPTMLCGKDGDHVVLEVPDTLDVFSVCSAGSGGTDISGASHLNLVDAGVVSQVAGEPAVTLTFSGNANKEYTHYRIYATPDVGVNGINPANGAGNSYEDYAHVEDVPKCAAFIVSSTGNGVVTASAGTFKPYHTGGTLVIPGVGSLVDIAYVNATTVTYEGTFTFTSVPAAIGGTPFIFSQSSATMTGVQGSAIDDLAAGDVVFVSDGGILHIAADGTNDDGAVTAVETATRVNAAGVKMPTGSWVFTDTLSDEILSSRLSKYWLKNRFWQPLPNCNVGVEVDGFFISAVRGEKTIYQTQLANPYLAGYYDPEFQVDIVQDAIQALREYNGILAAICTQSTVTWSTELTGTDSRPGIGSSVSFLTQKKVADERTGTASPWSIAAVSDGMDILFTNNYEVKVFDGKTYGPNLAEGKITKLMRQLQMVSAASYDPLGGYLMWGTDGALVAGEIPFPDVCYRFALSEEQGVIGGIRYDGDDWIKPPHGIGGYEVSDDNGHSLQVAFDNRSGKFYWISTYDGPTGSGLSKTFLDKDDGAGVGTEIDWSLSFGADTGSLMKYDIRHEVSNLTIDPYDPSNAGATGYDSEGFRSGLEIDFYLYGRANAWETPVAQSLDIIKDGDISFDETPQDKAFQIKIVGNRSECVISELVSYYVVMEQAAIPEKRATTESDHQLALAAPVLWLSRGPNLYLNRATGQVIAGTPVGVTGVDGKVNSAFRISSPLPTISVSLTTGSILFWADGAVTVSVGGAAVAMTSAGTHGGWTLYYATQIGLSVPATGILTLTPVGGARKIEDLRVYNSDVSSDTRTYIYNDIIRNDGDNVMGLW
jgi:hypothetical protein